MASIPQGGAHVTQGGAHVTQAGAQTLCGRRGSATIGVRAAAGLPTPWSPTGGPTMRHGKPRNFVQPCLLLLLLEHPDHGYALVERLDSFLLAEGDAGAVYRSLHALEVSGAVRSTWGLSESGPARPYLSLDQDRAGAVGGMGAVDQ